MASDMMESCINRTLQAFQMWERKGSTRWTSTDYIVPSEMCAMINVILEAKNQSLKLCTFDGADTVSPFSLTNHKLMYITIEQHQYHAKIDQLVDKTLIEMQTGLIAKVFNFNDFRLNLTQSNKF